MLIGILTINLRSSLEFQDTILKLIDDNFTYKQKIAEFYTNFRTIQVNKNINGIMINENALLNAFMNNNACFINTGFS